MDWAKTTARRDEKYLSFGIGAVYIRGLTVGSSYDVALSKTVLNATQQREMLKISPNLHLPNKRHSSPVTDAHFIDMW